jgi:hypothetical protein
MSSDITIGDACTAIAKISIGMLSSIKITDFPWLDIGCIFSRQY